jgi:hypothetical protein
MIDIVEAVGRLKAAARDDDADGAALALIDLVGVIALDLRRLADAAERRGRTEGAGN